METKTKEQKRNRKVYAAKGQRSQKMMTFRLDNDLAEWLTHLDNKGRYINNLIRADMQAH